MKEEFKNKLIIFNSITNIFLIIIILSGGFIWADSNGVWNRAEDIIAGTFGSDENGGDYVFPNNLKVKDNLNVENNTEINNNLNIKNNVNIGNNLCLGNHCHKNWSSICQEWVNENTIN